MPLTADNARIVVKLTHAEWREHSREWRWMLDSLEGGGRYRNAVYGMDARGILVRNLVRHKREYPDPAQTQNLNATGFNSAAGSGTPGSDANTYATDDDYELRRARTPVPTFVREAVDKHLSKVLGKEVARAGPDGLEEWWKDVDGQGTAIGDWLKSVVAPMFMCLGQLDVLIDHPPAPAGAKVRSKADASGLGLDRAVASYILPENILWWRLNSNGTYAEVVIQEFDDNDFNAAGVGAGQGAGAWTDPTGKAGKRFRHWDSDSWTLIDGNGEIVKTGKHPFGRVPVVRVFDRRKPRCRNVGQSRYSAIAERQREYYNRDSELILSDTTQAHPLMQGPEDFVQADGTIPIGPTWLLPKKKNSSGGSVSYEGFEVIDFPKGAAESLRQNKADIREDVDRDAKLTRPPTGKIGSKGGAVAQSGLSKQFDHGEGHDLMVEVAASLCRLEKTLAEIVLLVLGDGALDQAEADAIIITYPMCFDLQSSDDLETGLGNFQALLAASGDCPEAEVPWLQSIYRERNKGLSAAAYAVVDQAIEDRVNANAIAKGETAEARHAMRSDAPDIAPAGNAELLGGEEGERLPYYSTAPGYPLGTAT